MNFDSWMSNGRSPIDPAPRAVATWNRIIDRPTEVVIMRSDGTNLAPQTMRVEPSSGSTGRVAVLGPVKEASIRRVTVFGVVGHPSEDIPDTDIRARDRFVLDEGGNTTEYSIIDVAFSPGQVQGRCEAVT